MSHNIPLITMLATAFGLALLLGFIAVRLRLPVLVGYILAGIVIGPHTPGFVAHAEIARELAEIGVMLLMFGVGLHFSLGDLIEVRKIALPGAVLQIFVATLLGTWVATTWGWKLSGSLIFGLSLSVASTVVLLRALEAENIVSSISGRIAVGWLVVEDLAMIIAIVLIPPLAGWIDGKPQGVINGNLVEVLGVTLVKVSAFFVLMIVAGRKIFPKILWLITKTGSRELFTLCVITTAITTAFIAAKLFGVSYALGAFFAGMMMRESPLSHRAAEESLPLREAFAVLFFVSIGMLFDPMEILDYPIQVLTVLSIIVIGKSIAAMVIVLCFRYPLNTALLVSASLAQIGEFSFILAAIGVDAGLLPVEGQNLMIAGALISITINPLLFQLLKPLQAWITTRVPFINRMQHSNDPLAALPMTTDNKYLLGQVVLVGYGRVGRHIGEILHKNSIPYVVIEENREAVEELRANKMAAVYGDASDPEVLLQSHVAKASMLIIAIPETFSMHKMIKIARAANAKIEILVRVHNEAEMELLTTENVERIFHGEHELAKNIGAHVLSRYGIISSL